MQEGETIEEYAAEEDFEGKKVEGRGGKLSGFLNGKFFVPVVFLLVAIIAFSLGRISGLEEKREPVRVINNSSPSPLLLQQEKGATTQTNSAPLNSNNSQNSAAVAGVSSEQVVASKSGTKYHYPWCSGAKQISEKNKIYFDSIESARAAGYGPASNCKGLK